MTVPANSAEAEPDLRCLAILGIAIRIARPPDINLIDVVVADASIRVAAAFGEFGRSPNWHGVRPL